MKTARAILELKGVTEGFPHLKTHLTTRSLDLKGASNGGAFILGYEVDTEGGGSHANIK